MSLFIGHAYIWGTMYTNLGLWHNNNNNPIPIIIIIILFLVLFYKRHTKCVFFPLFSKIE